MTAVYTLMLEEHHNGRIIDFRLIGVFSSFEKVKEQLLIYTSMEHMWLEKFKVDNIYYWSSKLSYRQGRDIKNIYFHITEESSIDNLKGPESFHKKTQNFLRVE